MKTTILLSAILAVALPAFGFDGQERRVIRVSAERFAFTPSRIEVEAGEDVELRIRSDDTSHSFRVSAAKESGVEIKP